ncbi:DEAD/DEAH box helicase [Frankia sp. CN7]|uniref:RNA helicase n=1 Tax=Frankia nepalensis TaxID=1836974 RepID=A0A937RMB0_9ACTN|nr:DEAD/DEAH box helicase [Frankia nepalensis]MBL7502403.1 DEAD/DEAH box helicase [Frankia nepalensis]MBL7628511.1 DEAD/DEAH box helicase [Frankia nepalensis]
MSDTAQEQTRSDPLSVTATPLTTTDTTTIAEQADPTEQAKLTFADLGVRAETVEALAAAGIIHPFAIQELTLPLALAGTDIIGQARTGTGKTLGFGIPLVQKVLGPAEGADGRPQALVVVPTRELCVQVTADLNRAGAGRAIRLLSVYGGRAYEPQISALRAGVDIVVGTPGRLLDLARQHALDLGAVATLVLDEADEMLDLGFLPDVERIVALLPPGRQTMLFSATMPGPVIALARRFMIRPVHVTAEQPDEGRTVPTTSQHVFRAHALDKMEVLARVLQAGGRGLSMVFVRTRRTADKVAEDLSRRGFAAAAVHGDLGQGQREQALRAFRSGKVDVLVATDVAARGIDVGGVTHVVNYQCPEDESVYLHRIGRTGRAGGSGVAVTFVDWDDLARWQLVNKALALPFDEPLETYSTSPHLFEQLEIPTEATGVLPRAARTRAGLAAEEIEDLGGGRRGRRPGRAAETRDNDRETARQAAATRTRTRRRTRGAGAAAAAAAGTAEDGETAEVTAGDASEVTELVTVTDAAAAGTAETDAAVTDAEVTELTAAGVDAVEQDGEVSSPARRRRRRRGGRGGSRSVSGAETLDGLADSGDASAERAESA